MKIGYDLDGVICNTMFAFHQFFRKKYDHWIFDSEKPEFRTPMPEDYDYKNIHDDIAEAINTYQRFLYPHSGSIEAIREIQSRSGRRWPIIITARSIKCYKASKEWLNKWLGDHVLVMVDGADNKMSWIDKFKLDYYVEDRYKTCLKMSKVLKSVFMPDRPWNFGRPLPDNVIKVRDLVDVKVLLDRKGELDDNYLPSHSLFK